MTNLSKAVEESSKRLSKTHTFKLEFMEKDLFLLRERYKDQHTKAQKRFSWLKDMTNKDVVKYAVYEVGHKQLKKKLKQLQRQAKNSKVS